MPDQSHVFPNAVDLVVVGGGHAALCAAITAREAGARVILLESAPIDMRGGNSRHTRNLRAVHQLPTSTMSGSYLGDEFWDDLARVTDGRTDASLARLMIDESEPLREWLAARGVRFQPALKGTLGLARTNAFFLGGGKALLNALYAHAEAIDVDCRWDAEVCDIQIDQGEVSAVQVKYNATISTIAAGGAVIASGGFQSNTQWMREVWGPAADNFLIRGTPYNTGTMLRCLLDKGMASVGDPTQCHAVAIDARAPKFDGGIVSRLDCVPFGIVVNQVGERFYDEGEDVWPKRYAIWGRLVASQPEQIAYSIIDSKVTENFMPSVYPAIETPTLAALASAIGVAPDALEETVGEFNRSVIPGSYEPGSLDDCRTLGLEPAKSHWALPIDAPPFFAYPLRPGITFTYLGLRVNENAQVLRVDGTPCGNLFAAGEVMAGNILGQGYCAGIGMTIGGVFGRIAGSSSV